MINEAQSANGYRYTTCIDDCNRHRNVHDLAKLLYHILCFFCADKSDK